MRGPLNVEGSSTRYVAAAVNKAEDAEEEA
jgi:hypothetical protein